MQDIGVELDAIELNSNRQFTADNPTAGTVTAQSVPELGVALVPMPSIVTRGAQAILQVNVTNPAGAATVALDRANTRVSFGAGPGGYSALLDIGSPIVIAGGQTELVSFDDEIVSTLLTQGPYALNVDLAYTANGVAYSQPEVIANGITVQNPPQFQITAIEASAENVTAGQTQDWTATMTIVNTGSADIDLNLSPSETYVRFLAGGIPDTTYDIVFPTELVGGGNRIAQGAQRQLEFRINETGDVPGIIIISGRVLGTDINQQSPVSDDTFGGGGGSINVQPAAAVAILATRPSQPELTQGQNGWGVRVILSNTGGSDVDIDFANSRIEFNGTRAGWKYGSVSLIGGGNRLEAGAVDSLLFAVDSTTTVANVYRIDAFVTYTEVNSSTVDSLTTSPSGNFGTVKVETRPRLRITTAVVDAPNPNAVNVSQDFTFRIQVQNLGEADARDVAISSDTEGQSTVAPSTSILEVPGLQTVVHNIPATAATGADPQEIFSADITSATDENSGENTLVTLSANQDSTETIAIQTMSSFEITNVRPSQATVTRSQATPWNVIVNMRNTGQSGAVLAPPAANDISFSIAGSTKIGYVVVPPTQFASGRPGWTLAGMDADSLIYTVAVTGPDPGVVDIAVANDGMDRNDPTQPFSDTDTTQVNVQSPAGFAIASTVSVGTVNASADQDTVNTNFQYQIHVTVDNTGEAIDNVLVLVTSNLSAAQRSSIVPVSTTGQSIDADDSHIFIFNITAPANPTGVEAFTADIQPGVVSRNTGQEVSAQTPIDRRHEVVTQRPANLAINLTSASGAVSTNQVFTISATVTNSGQAGVENAAQLQLALPPGASFTHLNSGNEPLLRDFTVGVPVTWQIQAPAAPQPSENFSVSITTIPDDRNTGVDALVSQNNDVFAVTVVSGGAFAAPIIAIDSPAGAVDATVSAAQHFFLDATVTATVTTNNVVATLTVPPGYQVVGQQTRNLGDGTGNPISVNNNNLFEIIAPALTGSREVFVTFTGVDENTQQPVPTSADTITVTTVGRAALTVTASVTDPPEARDNTVSVGTTFTVTANVSNAAGAAGIASPGTLTVQLPNGYVLSGGEVAAKPFNIATAVTWQVDAPQQPSGPQQINVSITGIPLDENSGQDANIVDLTANIAMVTEGAAVAVRDVSSSLGIDVGPVPAGTDDIRILGFEIAYNVSDPSVADARIDSISVTIFGPDGSPLGPGTVAGTLEMLSIDIGGPAPVEVVSPSTNPVVVSFLSLGNATERMIAPDAARNATVTISLDANPSAKELTVGLQSGGVCVRDDASNTRLGVTDEQGQPLDGNIASETLVVLSSSFEEYVHNYPNPFRAGSQDTRIAYVMDQPGSVSVRIYAVDGSLVYEESIPAGDSRAQAGPQETTWDGRNGKGEVVRNGVYVCVLNAGGRSARFRIAVAK